MNPDLEAKIQKARQMGVSEAAIQQRLRQKGIQYNPSASSAPGLDSETQPDQGFLEKLVRGNTIPASTAAITGLIGTGAGVAAGGLPALALGPASVGGGYIAGQGIKSGLARLLGYDLGEQDPLNNLTQDPNPMKAAMTDLIFKLSGRAFNFLKDPNKSLTGALDYLVGKNTTPVNLLDIASEFKGKADPLTQSLTQGNEYQSTIRNMVTKLLNRPQDRTGNISAPLSKVNELRQLTGDDIKNSANYVAQKLSKTMYPILRSAVTKNEPLAAPILGIQSGLYSLADFAEHIPFGINRLLSGLGRIGGKIAGAGFGGAQGAVENPILRSGLMQYLLSQPNQTDQGSQ